MYSLLNNETPRAKFGGASANVAAIAARCSGAYIELEETNVKAIDPSFGTDLAPRRH